jgi:hypothetical protein
MAVLTGTTLTYGIATGGGLREDLSDVIFDLFPEDTYLLSNLDKEDASATYTDATFASLTPPSRYGSYLQISSKTFLVSDTIESVVKAGRKSEVARGAIVKMRELKRDIETRIAQNGISTVGGATTGRSTAGIESWIGGATADPGATTANAVRATTSANTATTPPVTSGTAGTAPTDGSTTGALTNAVLNQALMGAWAQGGNPAKILVGAVQKQAIDAFTGQATRFVDVMKGQQASIVGAANVYVSDYGTHQVILHRYMRASIVLCLDTDFWAIRWLRKPIKRELAKTGDGTKYQIICEWALAARNWRASSKIVACT